MNQNFQLSPINYGAAKRKSSRKNITDTREMEKFLFEGGAIGDAERAMSGTNKAASVAITAATAMAGSAVTGGTAAAGAASALSAAGASTSVPVAGWIVAGVLVLAAGGIALSGRRLSRFLAKDRGIFERYVRRFSRKSADWRLRYARKQIAKIGFEMRREQKRGKLGILGQKRKAKAALKLEALYYIYKKEGNRGAKAKQKAESQRALYLADAARGNALVAFPIYIGLASIVAITMIVYQREK
jgi:hypothetical protein